MMLHSEENLVSSPQVMEDKTDSETGEETLPSSGARRDLSQVQSAFLSNTYKYIDNAACAA